MQHSTSRCLCTQDVFFHYTKCSLQIQLLGVCIRGFRCFWERGGGGCGSSSVGVCFIGSVHNMSEM